MTYTRRATVLVAVLAAALVLAGGCESGGSELRSKLLAANQALEATNERIDSSLEQLGGLRAELELAEDDRAADAIALAIVDVESWIEESRAERDAIVEAAGVLAGAIDEQGRVDWLGFAEGGLGAGAAVADLAGVAGVSGILALLAGVAGNARGKRVGATEIVGHVDKLRRRAPTLDAAFRGIDFETKVAARGSLGAAARKVVDA